MSNVNNVTTVGMGMKPALKLALHRMSSRGRRFSYERDPELEEEVFRNVFVKDFTILRSQKTACPPEDSGAQK